MKLETAFDINNIVVHKFSKNKTVHADDSAQVKEVFEVIETLIQTCYGGTQVFYHCRPLHLSYIKEYKEGKSTVIFRDVSAAHMSGGTEYCKFREDELKPASQEIIDLLLNNN